VLVEVLVVVDVEVEVRVCVTVGVFVFVGVFVGVGVGVMQGALHPPAIRLVQYSCFPVKAVGFPKPQVILFVPEVGTPVKCRSKE
jgi:hypothetical protein